MAHCKEPKESARSCTGVQKGGLLGSSMSSFPLLHKRSSVFSMSALSLPLCRVCCLLVSRAVGATLLRGVARGHAHVAQQRSQSQQDICKGGPICGLLVPAAIHASGRHSSSIMMNMSMTSAIAWPSASTSIISRKETNLLPGPLLSSQCSIMQGTCLHGLHAAEVRNRSSPVRGLKRGNAAAGAPASGHELHIRRRRVLRHGRPPAGDDLADDLHQTKACHP